MGAPPTLGLDAIAAEVIASNIAETHIHFFMISLLFGVGI
jgi:hypothetical protein